jgi:hypothetical protein
LYLDRETIIPAFFNDKQILIHLAFILYPQLGENALEKLALEYLEDEDEEDPEMVTEAKEAENAIAEVATDDPEKIVEEEKSDSDLEMLDNPPTIFMAPQKKTIKVKEQLEDSFLWRSKRVSQKLGGLKNEDSTKKFKEAQVEEKPSGPKVVNVDGG